MIFPRNKVQIGFEVSLCLKIPYFNHTGVGGIPSQIRFFRWCNGLGQIHRYHPQKRKGNFLTVTCSLVILRIYINILLKKVLVYIRYKCSQTHPHSQSNLCSFGTHSGSSPANTTNPYTSPPTPSQQPTPSQLSLSPRPHNKSRYPQDDDPQPYT